MYDNQNNPYAAPGAPNFSVQPLQGMPQTPLPPEMIHVSTGARLNLISLVVAILVYIGIFAFGFLIAMQAAQKVRGNVQLMQQELEKHNSSIGLVSLLGLVPILISLYGYTQYSKIPEESQARPDSQMLVIFGIVTLALSLASSILPILGIISVNSLATNVIALLSMILTFPYYYFYFSFLKKTSYYIQDAQLAAKVKTLSTFAFIFVACGLIAALLNLVSDPMNQQMNAVALLRIPLGLGVIVTGIVSLVFYIQCLLRLQKVINYRTQMQG